jgi:tRNA-binding protein
MSSLLPARPEAGAEDFERIDMRVGRILEVEDFPRARRPSYRLRIDFGELGERRSSAGLKPYYTVEELVGRLVICVVNLGARNIAGFVSEVLVLGATEPDGRIRLLSPDSEARLGSHVS